MKVRLDALIIANYMACWGARFNSAISFAIKMSLVLVALTHYDLLHTNHNIVNLQGYYIKWEYLLGIVNPYIRFHIDVIWISGPGDQRWIFITATLTTNGDEFGRLASLSRERMMTHQDVFIFSTIDQITGNISNDRWQFRGNDLWRSWIIILIWYIEKERSWVICFISPWTKM